MNKRELLGWLTTRRETKVYKIMQKHLTKVIDTVTELNKAISASVRKNESEVEQCVARLFKNEEEADILRRELTKELTKGELPAKDREDLMRLVMQIDVIADWAKDGARNISVIIKQPVPEKIWKKFEEISESTIACILALREAVNMLEADMDAVMKNILEVERLEHRVDDEYHDAKFMFLEFAKEIDAPTFLILKDVLHDVEKVADSCEDAADIVHIIAIRITTSRMS